MDDARARTEIERARKAWIAAINAGDPHGFVATLTDDAVWLPFRGPAVSGKSGILEWLRGFFQKFDYEYRIENPRLRVAGGWAVERAVFETRAVDREGQAAPVHRGTYTVIWCDTEAGWRIERYVDSTSWDDADGGEPRDGGIAGQNG